LRTTLFLLVRPLTALLLNIGRSGRRTRFPTLLLLSGPLSILTPGCSFGSLFGRLRTIVRSLFVARNNFAAFDVLS
jgi:hypothetical protein